MPTCPGCGLDVQKEGLCDECRAIKNTKKPNTKKNRSGNDSKKKTNYVLNIWLVVLFFLSGFFIGWLIFTNPFKGMMISSGNGNITQSEDGKETDSSKVNQNDDGASDPQKSDTRADTVLSSKATSVFSLSSRKDSVPVSNRDEYIAWMTAHTKEKPEFLEKRWKCAQTLLTWSKSKSITHDRVFEAFLRTPRENFCREKNLSRAYDFTYLDIGWGQTISGPEIVARMTNALNPQPEHKTLEIGTGSGYQSAFLAELSENVFTIEIIEELAKVTDSIYSSLISDYPEYQNVHKKIADGYYGWEENAPFDRIIVTCGIDHIPPPLLMQLAPEGVMVIPVGPPSGQTILKITKHIDTNGNVTLEREDIYSGMNMSKASTVFVPFKAADGSNHSTARDAD